MNTMCFNCHRSKACRARIITRRRPDCAKWPQTSQLAEHWGSSCRTAPMKPKCRIQQAKMGDGRELRLMGWTSTPGLIPSASPEPCCLAEQMRTRRMILWSVPLAIESRGWWSRGSARTALPAYSLDESTNPTAQPLYAGSCEILFVSTCRYPSTECRQW